MNLTKESALNAFELICKKIETDGLFHNYDADHGAQILLPYIWKECGLDNIILPQDCEYIYIGLKAGNYIEVDSYSQGATVYSRPPGIHPIMEKAAIIGYDEINLFKAGSHMDDKNACYTFRGWQIRACDEYDR